MQVIRLRPYLRAMKRMGFGDNGMHSIEARLLVAPDAHPVVQGLRGVRKARFARPGSGKSGGGRVLYYLSLAPGRLFMLTAYPKSARDDLSPDQRKAILAAIDSIKGDRS